MKQTSLFMEAFISDFEAEKVSTLSTYLQASGLDNCELSKEETDAIKKLQTVQSHKYRIGDLFDKSEIKNFYIKQKNFRIAQQISMFCIVWPQASTIRD